MYKRHIGMSKNILYTKTRYMVSNIVQLLFKPALLRCCQLWLMRMLFLPYNIILEYGDLEAIICDTGGSSQQNSVAKCGVKLSISSLYGCRRYPVSTYGSQPQIYPHHVRIIPAHIWYLPQEVPNQEDTG